MDIPPEILESFLGSPQIIWPSKDNSIHIGKISISGELINPHVELVDELPFVPLSLIRDINAKRTELQKKQATELFDHLIESGISRVEALEMMGPLAAEITKYRHSFHVSEARWTVKGLIGKQILDRPFMAPVKK
jgi:hypothetical protein